jgi:hypothetical protein
VPSYLHEVLVEMFRDRPTLVADLLSGPLGVKVPAFGQAMVSSGELTDIAPTEFRADVVIILTAPHADTPVLAVVVEAQLSADARKRHTWPAYVATLHARLRCPVFLLVVCPDPAVAAWCAARIVVSDPGLALTPLVLGPHQVPVVTDSAWARRSPELAVLSAMAHGGGPDQQMVFDSLLAALEVLDHDHADLYADVVLAVLPAAARDYLEGCMTTTTHRYQSDFARRYFDAGEAEGEEKGRAEGKAEGEAWAVLAVLSARGIEVPDDVRQRIEACTDLEQLGTWIRRAVTAVAAQDIFEDNPT